MDVSTEALRIVKTALEIFKSDIQGIGTSAVLQNQKCIEECENNISRTQMKVQQLEDKVAMLTRVIMQLEEKIVSMQNELQQIDKIIPQLEQHLQGLHSQLNQLLNRLAVLQERLAKANDDETRKQIQKQIDAVQSRIDRVRGSIQSTEHQISKCKDRKTILKQSIAECSSQKEHYENELSVSKRRLNKYQQKLEYLCIAKRNVQSDFNAYVQSVKKFESSTTESANSKHKVVDECIGLIEEMESVM